MATSTRKRMTADDIASMFWHLSADRFSRYELSGRGVYQRMLTAKQTAWLIGTFARENPGVPVNRCIVGGLVDDSSNEIGTWDLYSQRNGSGNFHVYLFSELPK